MSDKYEDPRNIPDKAILDQWKAASKVKISLRNFNTISNRSISFGDLGWWVPLIRVFPLVGITPQKLRPVFNWERKLVVKKRFSIKLRSLLGLKNSNSKVIRVRLPTTITSYKQLGHFTISDKRLVKLARILDKTIEVYRYDGSTGQNRFLLTAFPFGKVVWES